MWISACVCVWDCRGWRTHAGFCDLSGRAAVGFVHFGEDVRRCKGGAGEVEVPGLRK